MLSALLFWVYLLCLMFLYGQVVIALLSRIFPRSDQTHLPFTMIWLTGLACVISISSIFSVFIRLNWEINAVLLFGALGFLLWSIINRQFFVPFRLPQVQPYHLLLLCLALPVTIFISIGTPVNPDTGIYHAQAIRWIETYPAVPGLGNIHTRFAYNSSWLLANALFSFSFLGLRSFHLMSSGLFLVSLFYFFQGVSKLGSESIRPSDIIKTTFFPLSFFILGSEVSSPGTDLPAALMVWIIITEWMVDIEEKSFNHNHRPLIISLLSFYVVTVKLSSLPLLLIPLSYFLRALLKRQFRLAAGLTILGILILTPWITRTVIISGYPIFPLPEVNPFNFDWRIPSAIALQDRITTMAWSRPWISGQTAGEVAAMPISQWAPLWFNYLTPNRRIIILVIICTPLLWSIWALIKPNMARFFKQFSAYLPVYLVSYFGLGYWFVSAPAFRFGYGFVMICFSLALLPIFALIFSIKPTRRLTAHIIISLLSIYQVFLIFQTYSQEAFHGSWLFPADYKALPTERCSFANFETWCASSWDECWYDPFPCVPRPDPNVEKRGKKLEEGFKYIVNLN